MVKYRDTPFLDGDTTLADVSAIRRFHTSYRQGGNIITKEEYEEKKAREEAGLIKPWVDIGYHWVIENIDNVPFAIRGVV